MSDNTTSTVSFAPSGKALSSVIIGAVSIVLSWPLWIVGAGVVGGTISLVLGAAGRRRGQSKRLTLIGMILGAVAILSGIIAFVYYFSIIGTALNDPEFQQRLDELKEQASN